MNNKTDKELKELIETAIAELYNRGYDVSLYGVTSRPRRLPVVECKKVIKL